MKETFDMIMKSLAAVKLDDARKIYKNKISTVWLYKYEESLCGTSNEHAWVIFNVSTK